MEGEIEVGAAAVSCGDVALSSSRSGACVGMEGGIEASKTTARCGGALSHPPGLAHVLERRAKLGVAVPGVAVVVSLPHPPQVCTVLVVL